MPLKSFNKLTDTEIKPFKNVKNWLFWFCMYFVSGYVLILTQIER